MLKSEKNKMVFLLKEEELALYQENFSLTRLILRRDLKP